MKPLSLILWVLSVPLEETSGLDLGLYVVRRGCVSLFVTATSSGVQLSFEEIPNWICALSE